MPMFNPLILLARKRITIFKQIYNTFLDIVHGHCACTSFSIDRLYKWKKNMVIKKQPALKLLNCVPQKC